MNAIIYTRSKEIDGLKVKLINEAAYGITYENTETKTPIFIPYQNIDRIEYL